jgi:Zn-dependent protease
MSALERLRQLEEQKRAQAAAAAAAASGATADAAAAPSRNRGPVVGGLVAAGLLAWKLKSLLFLAKFAKFATTGFTMILMVLVYARFYGAGFAVGLVLLILIHELGHGYAAKRVGLDVGAPVFIPFFGAFIALKEKPKSTWQDFVIGAGGPLFGSLGGVACVAASFFFTGDLSGLLLAVGYFALMMNLFNLIPFWQLDGSRMMGPVSLNLAAAGTVLLLAVVGVGTVRAAHVNPFALGVAGVSAWKVGTRWWEARQAKQRLSALEQLHRVTAAQRAISDDGVTQSQRVIAASVYFGLAALLIIAMHELPALLPRIPR